MCSLSLTPQCSRQPGPSVGGPHLAWQLWTLPRLVPKPSGGIWGKVHLFCVNGAVSSVLGLSLSPSRWCVCLQVSRGHVRGRAWLFVGRCWLAVIKGDGQVERRLRVCTRGIGFAKVDLSHRHMNTMICIISWSLLPCDPGSPPCRCWVSSFRTTWPTITAGYLCSAAPAIAHSHTLKDLAWTCCSCWGTHVSTQPSYHGWMIRWVCETCCESGQLQNTFAIIIMLFLISCLQLPFELGFTDVSAVSVTAGVLSVLAVLPAAGIISFLFRLRDVELARSGVRQVTGRKTEKATLEGEVCTLVGVFFCFFFYFFSWISM